MATLLDTGASLDALREGEYIVTDPDTDLAASTYLIFVTVLAARSGRAIDQQIAYKIDDGDEFYRARSTSNSLWTDWLPRASVDAMDGATITATLDAYFGGTTWRAPTNLSIANRDSDSLDVLSSTGDDITIPAATTALAGLMTAADKTALDSGGVNTDECVAMAIIFGSWG
jgi:hypothetical protein